MSNQGVPFDGKRARARGEGLALVIDNANLSLRKRGEGTSGVIGLGDANDTAGLIDTKCREDVGAESRMSATNKTE